MAAERTKRQFGAASPTAAIDYAPGAELPSALFFLNLPANCEALAGSWFQFNQVKHSNCEISVRYLRLSITLFYQHISAKCVTAGVRKNPSTLHVLRTDVVMVALNFAREVEMHEPFLNFHDPNPHGQDYKIRFAFEDTEYYGAYMTDIIKDFPMLSSKDVLKHLKEDPQEITKQINSFEAELDFIGSNKPKILAFGKDAYNILNKNMNRDAYSELIALTHYSHQISIENYRIDTHEKLYIL